MKRNRHSQEEKIAAATKYLNGECGLAALSEKLDAGIETVREWIRNYQCMGSDAFDSTKNKCYPKELKEKAVQEYLDGKGSISEICKMYKIKSTKSLRMWILKYNNHEPLKSYAGGRGKVMVKGRKTTLQERIDIVKDHMESGSSYEEIAEKHQISYQQIYQWVRKYQENGIDGLVDRRGKRKEQDAMTEEEKLRAELKMEKAKNKRLEMENLFLKKLEEIERRRY